MYFKREIVVTAHRFTLSKIDTICYNTVISRMLKKDMRSELKNEEKYNFINARVSTFRHYHVFSRFIKNKRSFLYGERLLMRNCDAHRFRTYTRFLSPLVSQKVFKIPLKNSYRDNCIIRKEYKYHE